MVWQDVPFPWQIAMEEAWAAFCAGSTPIGAALFDEDGRLIARDRNRAAEPETLNRRISHAEANLLRSLDSRAMPNIHTAVLYCTMEPCPMCMGTAVMAGIRRLRYGARDPWCGAVHLKDASPWMASKQLDYAFDGAYTAFFQLVLQSCYELRCIERGASPNVLESFRGQDPAAVALAEQLRAEALLEHLAGKNATCKEVYGRVARGRSAQGEG